MPAPTSVVSTSPDRTSRRRLTSSRAGERNRVHLAMTLKEGGNVLLLDEPTNDLDVNTLRALEDALDSFAGTVLLISHDRWFMDRLATHIIAFEGDSTVTFFEGKLLGLRGEPKGAAGGSGAAAAAVQECD